MRNVINYNIGDVLVFIGSSKKFEVGKSYKIFQKGIVDYEIDDVDN